MKPSSSKHALSPDRNHPESSTILWPFLPKYFVAIEGFFILEGVLSLKACLIILSYLLILVEL